MKIILFLLISTFCTVAHAQMLPSDAKYFNSNPNQFRAINNGIANMNTTVVKPLQNTVTKLVADTALKSKKIADLAAANTKLGGRVKGMTDSLLLAFKQGKNQDSLIKVMRVALDSARFLTKQLNDSIGTNRFRDSVSAVAIRKLIDDRSASFSLTDFITINGITSLNMQAIIDRIKANLKLPL